VWFRGGLEAATLTCSTSATDNTGNIVCGSGATANTGQSIAIGGSSNAIGDQSVAVGANTNATGNSSIAIGGDDLDKVASTSPPAYNVNAPNTNNNTAAATKYKTLTGDDLVNFADVTKRYVSTQAGNGAVAIGVQAVATGELGTAFGTKAKALGVASVGLGVGANASLENAVALGAGATTVTNATAVTSASVGTGASALTYANFGGANVSSGDQVSVGSVGYERQIKNVAPGAVSTSSTDAINGSQLYSVAVTLQDKLTRYYSVKSSNTAAGSNYANDGATGTDSMAAGVSAVAAGASAVAVGTGANANKDFTTVVGSGGKANTMYGTVIGANANATGQGSIALGGGATTGVTTANGTGAIAIGGYGDSTAVGAKSNADYAVAIGSGSTTGGINAVAVGKAANATGLDTIALGQLAQANNTNAIAIGKNALANGFGSGAIAIGAGSNASYVRGTAVGQNTYASGNSVALGNNANASGANTLTSTNDSNSSATAVGYLTVAGNPASSAGDGATAIGARAQATGASAVAVGGATDGNFAKASGTFATAVGWNTNASADGTVALGQAAQATSSSAIAVGNGSIANNTSGIAIGKGAQATAAQAISIGTGNVVSGANAGAIGDPSYVSGAGTYTIGNNNGTAAAPVAATNSGAFGNNNALPTASTTGIRVVGNSNTVNSSNVMVMGNSVTVGTGLDGAVVLGNASTVSKAVDTASSTIAGTTFTYATAGAAPADGEVVSVGTATAPRQIQNVANGQVTSTSLDAINGSQLYAVANTLAGKLTHFYSVNSTDTTAGNYNNDGAKSTNSLAAGVNAVAGISGVATNATAMGYGAQALASDSVAIGTNAKVTATGAVNDNTGVAGIRGIAIGSNATSTMGQSIAIGWNALAQNTANASSSPTSAIAIGWNAQALGSQTTAIGESAGVGSTGYNNLALGTNAGKNVGGSTNVAIGSAAGNNLGSTVTESISIGYGAGLNVNAAATPFADYQFGQGHFTYIGSGSGRGSVGDVNVAIGQLAGQSVTGSANVGMGLWTGWRITGDRNTALGMAAGQSFTGDNNVALGRWAGSELTTAGGTAKIERSVSIGDASRGYGNDSVAIGTSAVAGVKDQAGTIDNAIAIGNGAQATAAKSISIGTGNVVSGANAGAIGDPSYVSGAGTYTIGNNNGTAAAPVAATESGAFGNNNALPTASTTGIRVVGNSNTVNSSNVMVMGNSVTVGTGLDGAVVLGNASTVSKAVDTASSTIAGTTFTYATAGAAPADGDVVSVGTATAPRQIQNVANGQVTATSLDAINGSQLYAVANTLAGKLTHFYSVKSTDTTAGNYNNDGATGTNALAAGVNTVAAGNQATAVGYNANAVQTESVAMGSAVTAAGQGSVAIGSNGTIAGTATNNYAVAIGRNNQATGNQSTVVGSNSFATANNAIALGTAANATNDATIAVGQLANASAITSTAIGFKSAASQEDALAVGTFANASGISATALGVNTVANRAGTVAVGNGAQATADGSTSMGNFANASGGSSVALGSRALASQANGVALGYSAQSTAISGIALGQASKATANFATAVGVGAQATIANSVALGTNSVTTVNAGAVGYDPLTATTSTSTDSTWKATTAAVSVGNGTTLTRQITSVAAGTNDTDAVNVAQLKKASIKPEVVAGTNVTSVAKTTGANGQDIYTVNANGTTASAGSTAVTVTAGAKDGNNVTDYAVDLSQASKDSLAKADTALQNITSSDPNLTVGTKDANGNITLDFADAPTFAGTVTAPTFVASGANPITMDGGTGKITGLTAGTLASDSKDAVNGSQLYAVGSSTASSLGGTSAFDPVTGKVTAGLTVGTSNYNTVQDALSALNTAANKHNTTTAGTNIEVVETANADGSKNYEVKTKDDVTFTKVTVGGITMDAGTNKISGLAKGTVSADSSDAINGSQLYGVSSSIKNILGGNSTVNPDGSLTMSNVGGTGENNIDDAIKSINTTANKGWNLTANGANSSNVAPGATVDLNNTDGNIKITKTGNNVSFDLAKDLKADSLTVGDTKVDTNGLTIAGGPSVTKAGIDAAGTKITNVANGAVTADSKDAVNGSQLYEVKNTLTETVKNATFGVTAQDGNSVINNLNKTVSIVGGADSAAAASGSNIKTVVKDGKVEVQMVDAPTFTGEVKANGGLTVGDHLTVKEGTKVDMGGNKITNVAAGTADTDAVNVGQVNAALNTVNQNITNLGNKLSEVGNESKAGSASAIATANLPQSTIPGMAMTTVGLGTYDGQSAIAVGLSKMSDNGKWVIKASATTNTQGKVGAGVGVGFHW
jgi:autotransporter adhesin